MRGHIYINIEPFDVPANAIVIGKPIDGLPSVSYGDTVMYSHYYRLLGEIVEDTPVILNQPLVSVNRNLLNYNCMRRYCQQSRNVRVFQALPIRQSKYDFMTLYDMIQENPFLKVPFDAVKRFENVHIRTIDTSIVCEPVEVSQSVLEAYERQKEKEFAAIKDDPDVVPRRLLRWAEKKHAVKDSLTERKPVMTCVVSQLKVEQYYWKQLKIWEKELNDACEAIQR